MTKLFLRSTMIILGIAVVAIIVLKNATPREPLPILGQVNDFSLTDSTNQPTSFADLQGKVWVADFIFTTCASICPTMTKNMASLHRSYVLENDVQLVSISVNPEQDSPEVLAKYAKRYGADTNKWSFLTGARDTIKEVALKSFKLGSVEDPVFHSAYFTLVDRLGRIRGYYDGTSDEDVAQIFKDIAFLMKEK